MTNSIIRNVLTILCYTKNVKNYLGMSKERDIITNLLSQKKVPTILLKLRKPENHENESLT